MDKEITHFFVTLSLLKLSNHFCLLEVLYFMHINSRCPTTYEITRLALLSISIIIEQIAPYHAPSMKSIFLVISAKVTLISSNHMVIIWITSSKFMLYWFLLVNPSFIATTHLRHLRQIQSSAGMLWSRILGKVPDDEGFNLNLKEQRNGSENIKLTQEDIKDELEYWRTIVICCVMGSNPPLGVIERYFKWI